MHFKLGKKKDNIQFCNTDINTQGSKYVSYANKENIQKLVVIMQLVLNSN